MQAFLVLRAGLFLACVLGVATLAALPAPARANCFCDPGTGQVTPDASMFGATGGAIGSACSGPSSQVLSCATGGLLGGGTSLSSVLSNFSAPDREFLTKFLIKSLFLALAGKDVNAEALGLSDDEFYKFQTLLAVALADWLKLNPGFAAALEEAEQAQLDQEDKEWLDQQKDVEDKEKEWENSPAGRAWNEKKRQLAAAQNAAKKKMDTAQSAYEKANSAVGPAYGKWADLRVQVDKGVPPPSDEERRLREGTKDVERRLADARRRGDTDMIAYLERTYDIAGNNRRLAQMEAARQQDYQQMKVELASARADLDRASAEADRAYDAYTQARAEYNRARDSYRSHVATRPSFQQSGSPLQMAARRFLNANGKNSPRLAEARERFMRALR
jgi:hypothetical protein